MTHAEPFLSAVASHGASRSVSRGASCEYGLRLDGSATVLRSKIPGRARLARLALLIALSLSSSALLAADDEASLPDYRPASTVTGTLQSVGDPAMRGLMDAWLAGFQRRQSGVSRGEHWDHSSDAKAFGALMYGLADLAPLARDPSAAELAPYAHQFAGDMMKSPLLVQVAMRDTKPAWIAVNRRPGAPLPQMAREFLAYALSREGQQLVAENASFRPLLPAQARIEREKLQGWVAELDPALPVYSSAEKLDGEIRSVGSDGMKSLMESWMHGFQRLHPRIRKGDRWEHLGTLNGFHALLVGETDLAPMGRELWPSERAAWDGAHPGVELVEIKVARGGFNTPQRTTAQAVFVAEGNPLERISLAQIVGIFGQPQTITRWGQLGLTGAWKDRPIAIYMPPRVAPNAMSMQMMALDGHDWAASVHEGTIAATAEAIAREPGAIGFGGFEEGGPGLKPLQVARTQEGPYYKGEYASASSGRYPLTRYMYIRYARIPGQAIPAADREFLRFILSRQGQEPILYSGYFPLRADEIREELEKLD